MTLSMIPRRWKLAAPAALAALAMPATLAAQAPPQMLVDVRTHLAVDDKCKLLPPVERLALELATEELRPQVSPADMALIDQRLAQVGATLADKPYSDPMIAAARGPVLDAGGYFQAVWSARVRSVANLRSSTLWTTWSDVAGAKRSAAEQRIKTWAAARPGAEEQLDTSMWREASRLMAAICPTRSSNASQCPALTPPATPAEIEAATAWSARIERFAASLDGARTDGKPVLPAGTSDWGTLYAAMSLDMAMGMQAYPVACTTSTYVVRIDGPLPRDTVAATPATIFSARDGFEAGRGAVSKFGATYTLSGPWVEKLGSQTMGLVRCQSAP